MVNPLVGVLSCLLIQPLLPPEPRLSYRPGRYDLAPGPVTGQFGAGGPAKGRNRSGGKEISKISNFSLGASYSQKLGSDYSLIFFLTMYNQWLYIEAWMELI
jgi:hypothetical protein